MTGLGEGSGRGASFRWRVREADDEPTGPRPWRGRHTAGTWPCHCRDSLLTVTRPIVYRPRPRDHATTRARPRNPLSYKQPGTLPAPKCSVSADGHSSGDTPRLNARQKSDTDALRGGSLSTRNPDHDTTAVRHRRPCAEGGATTATPATKDAGQTAAAHTLRERARQSRRDRQQQDHTNAAGRCDPAAAEREEHRLQARTRPPA